MVWVAEPHVGSLVEVHLTPIAEAISLSTDVLTHTFWVLLLSLFSTKRETLSVL